MLAHHSGFSAADRRFLQSFLPDAEDAPWMAVTDWHLIALIAALLPLRWFAAASRPEWYVGSEIAVWYPLPEGGRNYVVPDIFVALAPSHPRTSFDVEREGGFPPFVLEIVSEESRKRDTSLDEKVRLYGLLGVEEYAIFDPEGHVQPQLQGHRRTPEGAWERWPDGARGELASGVLGLTLVADRTLLRLEDADGHRLLTPDEERRRAAYEHERAEQERARAEQERARADAAEARIADLEARLECLRRTRA
jgi:Uma2 family endonuclease